MLFLLLTLFQLHADPYVGQDFSGVWPGFNTQMPIVLNYPEGPKTFNFDSKLPAGIEKIALAPEFKVGGEIVFVMHYQDSFTFLHELFHRFQKDHFDFKESEGYPDLYNPENQALMQIEEEILLKYAKDRTDFLKNDYLLVRKYRMSRISEASLIFEDREERLEGLANFVAMKATNNIKPVIVLLEGLVKDKNVIDKSLKWRFYATGALMGMMLDREGKEWKQAVLCHSLFSQFTVIEDKVHLQELFEKYRFDEKKEAMTHQIEMIKKGVDRLQSEYKNSPGYEVQISYSSSLSSGGTVDKILALNENEKVALKESGRTESDEWVLETREIPFIFKTKQALIFKLQDSIEVDGRRVKIENMRDPVLFKEIAWSDNKTRFKSKKEGVLIPHENYLEISFQAFD